MRILCLQKVSRTSNRQAIVVRPIYWERAWQFNGSSQLEEFCWIWADRRVQYRHRKVLKLCNVELIAQECLAGCKPSY